MYHIGKLTHMNRSMSETLGNCTGPKIKQALGAVGLSTASSRRKNHHKTKNFLLFALETSLEITDLGKLNIMVIIKKY